MEKVNIVFLDEDSRYLDGISRFIQNNYSENVDIVCFNDVEKMQRDIGDNSQYDMLVVSSSLFSDARQKNSIKNICILIERSTSDFDGEFPVILKYQSGNSIYKEIMSIYESCNEVIEEVEVLEEIKETVIEEAKGVKEGLLSMFKEEDVEEVTLWSNNTIYVRKNNRIQIVNVSVENLGFIKAEREEIFSYIKDNGEYTCHGIRGDLLTGEGITILFINKDIDEAVITIYRKSVYSRIADKHIDIEEKVEEMLASNNNLLIILKNKIYEETILNTLISKVSNFNRVIELTNEVEKMAITITRVNKYIVNGNESLKMILDNVEKKLVRDFDEATFMDIVKVNGSSNKGIIYASENNSVEEFIESFEIKLGITTNLNFKTINKILLNSFKNIIYIDYEADIIKTYKLIESNESKLEVIEI